MTDLLNTNTCIRLLNDDRTAPVSRRLAMLQPEAIRLCSLQCETLLWSLQKFKAGAKASDLGRLFNQFSSLPLNDQAALLAGQMRFQLAASGTSIEPHDVLIGALAKLAVRAAFRRKGIALANNLTLVTHNTQKFARVVGLSLEDWE